MVHSLRIGFEECRDRVQKRLQHNDFIIWSWWSSSAWINASLFCSLLNACDLMDHHLKRFRLGRADSAYEQRALQHLVRALFRAWGKRNGVCELPECAISFWETSLPSLGHLLVCCLQQFNVKAASIDQSRIWCVTLIQTADDGRSFLRAKQLHANEKLERHVVGRNAEPTKGKQVLSWSYLPRSHRNRASPVAASKNAALVTLNWMELSKP